jgi:hypothetical protein
MRPEEPDEHVFYGEILTPDFIEWMRVCDLHQAFDELEQRYGRRRAVAIWHEIPQEHSDEPR